MTRYTVEVSYDINDRAAAAAGFFENADEVVVEAASPLEAVAGFKNRYILKVEAADAVGPEPKPQTRTYDEDGWLSERVAAVTAYEEARAHKPRFHIHHGVSVVCECGLSVSERVSKFGKFYPCRCGRKYNPGTPEFEALKKSIKHSCGRQMVVGVNAAMCGVDACPKCHPDMAQSQKRPISHWVGGR